MLYDRLQIFAACLPVKHAPLKTAKYHTEAGTLVLAVVVVVIEVKMAEIYCCFVSLLTFSWLGFLPVTSHAVRYRFFF
jgi:hypothetical protein